MRRTANRSPDTDGPRQDERSATGTVILGHATYNEPPVLTSSPLVEPESDNFVARYVPSCHNCLRDEIAAVGALFGAGQTFLYLCGPIPRRERQTRARRRLRHLSGAMFPIRKRQKRLIQSKLDPP